jgi:hypothetical protein
MTGPQKAFVTEIIQVLLARSAGLHMEQLEEILWKSRRADAPMPRQFRNVVYGTLSHYTSQSALFRQKRRRSCDDLFFSPGGKGSGTWAVHRDKAQVWLARQK